MDHPKSILLLVFIAGILISIVGVGRSQQEPTDESDCISGLYIVVLNSENMAALDGVNLYLNGRTIGTATNGQLYKRLPDIETPLRYKIEAIKRVSSGGCYYGKTELIVDCSDSAGISASIEIYAKYAKSCSS